MQHQLGAMLFQHGTQSDAVRQRLARAHHAIGADVQGNFQGIFAQSDSGPINLTGTGNVTGTNGVGVYALTNTGNIDLLSTGTVTGKSDGIYASAASTGNAEARPPWPT